MCDLKVAFPHQIPFALKAEMTVTAALLTVTLALAGVQCQLGFILYYGWIQPLPQFPMWNLTQSVYQKGYFTDNCQENNNK